MIGAAGRRQGNILPHGRRGNSPVAYHCETQSSRYEEPRQIVQRIRITPRIRRQRSADNYTLYSIGIAIHQGRSINWRLDLPGKDVDN